MNSLNNLAQGQGCSVDGTTTTNNPLTNLVDRLLQTPGQQQQCQQRVSEIDEGMRIGMGLNNRINNIISGTGSISAPLSSSSSLMSDTYNQIERQNQRPQVNDQLQQTDEKLQQDLQDKVQYFQDELQKKQIKLQLLKDFVQVNADVENVVVDLSNVSELTEVIRHFEQIYDTLIDRAETIDEGYLNKLINNKNRFLGTIVRNQFINALDNEEFDKVKYIYDNYNKYNSEFKFFTFDLINDKVYNISENNNVEVFRVLKFINECIKHGLIEPKTVLTIFVENDMFNIADLYLSKIQDLSNIGEIEEISHSKNILKVLKYLFSKNLINIRSIDKLIKYYLKVNEDLDVTDVIEFLVDYKNNNNPKQSKLFGSRRRRRRRSLKKKNY